jgi:hypothetical protein
MCTCKRHRGAGQLHQTVRLLRGSAKWANACPAVRGPLPQVRPAAPKLPTTRLIHSKMLMATSVFVAACLPAASTSTVLPTPLTNHRSAVQISLLTACQHGLYTAAVPSHLSGDLVAQDLTRGAHQLRSFLQCCRMVRDSRSSMCGLAQLRCVDETQQHRPSTLTHQLNCVGHQLLEPTLQAWQAQSAPAAVCHVVTCPHARA